MNGSCSLHYLQNAAQDVGDLMKLETSFTDITASHANSTSPSHPPTTLTFESETVIPPATSHFRQSVDTEQLVPGKPAEFRGKVQIRVELYIAKEENILLLDLEMKQTRIY